MVISEVLQLDNFVGQIRKKYPKLSEAFFEELKNEIYTSGALKIRFEKLSFAQGISKTDEVIINENILGYNITYVIYVIFHELVHQHQYRRLGLNFAYDLYNSKDKIEKIVDKLLEIELEADDVGIKKAQEFQKKFKLPKENLQSVYKNTPKKALIVYAGNLIKSINNKNITNVQKAEEVLYNMIKSKI